MSLNKKLNLTLVFVTTLILLAAGCWNVYSIRAAEMARLQQDADLILRRLDTTLPQTLWDFAPNQAKIIIAGELNNPAVVGVRILDGENKVFTEAAANSAKVSDAAGILKVEKPLFFSQAGTPQKVGVVELSLTTEKVVDTVNQAIITRALEIIILDVLLSIALAFALGRMVMRPLAKVLHSVNAIIADRDLGRRIGIRSRDELGELALSIDEFLEDIHQLVTEMSNATHSIQNIAHSIVTSYQALHAEVQLQRKTITSLHRAVEEIAQTARDVQRKSSETTELVGITQEDTSLGLRHVRNTAEKITDLSGDVGRSAEAIDQLKQNVDAISHVLDVIVSVADQTNLLALNAAIEAARAGETGRGFAVVADEVRSLAQRTQDSTREISSNLELLNRSTEKTVTAMRDSVPKARQSIDSSKDTGASIERISANVNSIQEYAREIKMAAEDQNISIGRMENCFGDISAAIEQTLRVADATKQLNQDLVSTLSTLQNLAKRFKTGAARN